MRKIYLTTIAALFAVAAESQTLIWSDEFNGATLDLTKWNYETGTGPNGDWGTCQVDAATSRPENVGIQMGVLGADGGALRITTRKEVYTVKGRNGGTRNYTSARVNTKDKGSWGPGHKLRARVWPRDVRFIGQGFAFWAMPNEIPAGQTTLAWPQGGEIDIMEYNGLYPYNNLGSVHFANEWANNRWKEGNHRHIGSFYSYETTQVPTESPQWLYVDLGAVTSISRVTLRWETAFGKSYQIQVSNDAVSWTTIYTTTTGDGGVDDVAASGSGRYVRMFATQRGTQWGYSLWEFEIYQTGPSNLALNKPAFSSSNENQTTLAASRAVDGSTSTRWASGSPDASIGPLPPSPADPNSGSSGWHVYGIDWYTDHIDFSVDEFIYHSHYFNDGGAFAADGADQKEVRVVNGRRITYSEYSNHFSEWHPFEHRFFLILSAGVGGSCTYGGAIVPEAQFPCSVFIDWVRVYRMDTAARFVTAPSGTSAIPEDRGGPGYPNPAKNSFIMPSVNNGSVVRIHDARGNLVARAFVRDHSIDVSTLGPGMYILRVSDGNKLRTFRIYKE